MKYPKSLILIIILFGIIGIVGLYLEMNSQYLLLNGAIVLFFWGCTGFSIILLREFRPLSAFSNFALISTFIAVAMYAYYAYLQAKQIIRQSEAIWEIAASFELQQTPEDPYHILFIIHNLSRYYLDCWCKLNPTVTGKVVSLEGFYDGKSPFGVQPMLSGIGHFQLRQIIENAGYSVKDMESKWITNPNKQLLYLNIDFWYYPPEKKKALRKAPRQPYYFDFSRKILVLDV